MVDNKIHVFETDINILQYNLEDLVRVEKKLKVVGEIALKIRDQNDHRVMLKNKINNLFVGTYQEVKLYKRHI